MTTSSIINNVGSQMTAIEGAVLQAIEHALIQQAPARNRAVCDGIFGTYSQQYLLPCVQHGLASRAAQFAIEILIPKVLDIEKGQNTEFHKGALFHDTAAAALMSGDQGAFEYFLAMTDEEEVKTTSAGHKRGTFNLGAGVAAQAIQSRLKFACDLLNGVLHSNAVTFTFITGASAITPAQLDNWRQRLEGVDQLELLRIIHDLEAFEGKLFPAYPAVLTNPFVLLRLAKTLSHFAQLTESCLTKWQIPFVDKSLGPKLKNDPNFGATMASAAGGPNLFAGSCPQGANVEISLRALLADIKTAAPGAQRQWRLLRIFYIVRNSTAHEIDASLPYYSDRAFLMEVIQTVFVSFFAIGQLKGKATP